MGEFDKNKLGNKTGQTQQTPGGARQTGIPGQPMGGVTQKPGQTHTGTGGTGNLNKQQPWDKKDKQR